MSHAAPNIVNLDSAKSNNTLERIGKGSGQQSSQRYTEWVRDCHTYKTYSQCGLGRE